MYMFLSLFSYEEASPESRALSRSSCSVDHVVKEYGNDVLITDAMLHRQGLSLK